MVTTVGTTSWTCISHCVITVERENEVSKSQVSLLNRPFINALGDPMVQWLASWIPDRAVRVRVLAVVIEFCFLARDCTLSASLHPDPGV